MVMVAPPSNCTVPVWTTTPSTRMRYSVGARISPLPGSPVLLILNVAVVPLHQPTTCKLEQSRRSGLLLWQPKGSVGAGVGSSVGASVGVSVGASVGVSVG